MAKKGSFSTRGEIQDNIQKQHDDMNEITGDLDIKATDTEIVRETLDSLDMDGFTAEGSDEVVDTIETAEDKTVELFEEEDEKLGEVVEQAKDYTDELEESQESDQKDLEKVCGASEKIETDETRDELAHTKSSIMEDLEFLDEQEKDGVDNQQETEQARKELQQRINSGRK